MSPASCTPSNSSLVANVSVSSANTSTSTATLGRSDQVPSKTAAAGPPQTASLDQFIDQNMFDDGTLHGRVSEHESRPSLGAYKTFYKTLAADAIAAFDAAFGVGQGHR